MLLKLWASAPLVLFALFIAGLGVHFFINAKKIVPPSRDPTWWIYTRMISPFFVAAGLGLTWWTVATIIAD
jgi:hypothetical protein